MTKQDPATLQDVLRSTREAQGLSIRQLATLVDVNPSQILRWERGERQPTADNLMALAMSLDLRASELFQLAGHTRQPGEASGLPAMLRAEYDLPPEAIAEIQRSIETVARRYKQTDADNKSTNS